VIRGELARVVGGAVINDDNLRVEPGIVGEAADVIECRG